MKTVRFLSFVFLACVLSACQLGPGEQVAAEATVQLPNLVETVLPTPTRTPLPLPSATALPSPTPTNRPAPLSGPILSADNITAAAPEVLKFPASGSGFYWPGGARLLLLQDNAFLQVNLEPLAVGAELPIRAPGRRLAASPDGSRVLVQAGDGGLIMWNSADQSSQPINFGVASFGNFSPDGKYFVLGSIDKIEVTLFDAATLKVIKTLSGFQTAAPVYEALINLGDDRLLWHARAKLQWMDIQTASMGTEYSYQDFVNSLAFSPDGKWLAVTTGGLVQILATQPAGNPDARDLVMNPDGGVFSAVFSADGLLVAAGVGTKIQVWETTHWKKVAELGQGTSPVRQVGFSPDGRVLAALDQENQLTIWRAR